MKVLLVEDNEGAQKDWIHSLRDVAVQVFSAFNLEQARKLCGEHSDIDVIVVDGTLGNEDGRDFVEEIRTSFPGKIIAASGFESSCLDMMRSGADFSCQGEKSKIPQIIKQILADQDVKAMP